jgi:sodium/hydrogen antiporter
VLSSPDWGPVPIEVETSSIHVIAEVTLALLLFSDAARVNLRELRRDVAMPVRLLGVGLPLSVVGGALLASLLFELPWGLVAFLGAALAPTDAALSAQVINDERIPMRRRAPRDHRRTGWTALRPDRTRGHRSRAPRPKERVHAT